MQAKAKLPTACFLPGLLGLVGLLGLLGLLGAAATARGDEFDDRLAKTCKELLVGTKTNAERTRKFHDAGRKARDDRMQIALLQKAVEFGKESRPPWALNLAKKSIDLLDRKYPRRKDEWLLLRIDLYRQGFRRLSGGGSRNKRILGEQLVRLLLDRARMFEEAHEWKEAAAAYKDARFPAHTLDLHKKDMISRKYTRAMNLARAQVAVEDHKRRLAKEPRDAGVRVMLLKALVVDMNSPRRAAGFLTEDVEEVWRTYVPMAAGGVAKLKPAACVELGDWYRSLADGTASPYAKANTLSRARECYRRFLKSNPDDVKAKVVLATVTEELKELGAEPVRPAPKKPGKGRRKEKSKDKDG